METKINFDRSILKDWQEGYRRLLIVLGVLSLLLILVLGFHVIFIMLLVSGTVAFLWLLPWAYARIKLTIYNGPQLIISETGVNFKNKNFYPWDEISNYRVMRMSTAGTGGDAGSRTDTRLIFKLKNGISIEISTTYFPLDESPEEIVKICDRYRNQ